MHEISFIVSGQYTLFLIWTFCIFPIGTDTLMIIISPNLRSKSSMSCLLKLRRRIDCRSRDNTNSLRFGVLLTCEEVNQFQHPKSSTSCPMKQRRRIDCRWRDNTNSPSFDVLLTFGEVNQFRHPKYVTSRYRHSLLKQRR